MEIWHNPRCSKSRQALALLTDAGVEPEVRLYLEQPPTVEQLRGVLARLDMQPWQLVRLGDDLARELGLTEWEHDEPDRWIEAMAANPRLIERPVVIDGDRAVLGRPLDAVAALLDPTRTA